TWAEGTPKLELPVIGEYIVKYQDPRQADSIMRIQQELDETKIVLHKTIESVLERGEKIDSLVQRSEGLSSASKMFYTQVWSGSKNGGELGMHTNPYVRKRRPRSKIRAVLSLRLRHPCLYFFCFFDDVPPTVVCVTGER